MRASITTPLLALAASVHALSDSSPFLLLSTASLPQHSDDVAQIQTDSQVLASVRDFLSSCPTERYLLASQPNAHAADVRGCSSTPHLCRAMSAGELGGKLSVAEVVGKIDVDALAGLVKKACGDRGVAADVKELKLSPLPRGQARSEVLGENDSLLGESLRKLQGAGSYTIIYLSSPPEPTYEAAFEEPLHQELKRDARAMPARRAANTTQQKKPKLFEKYQFFTPAIFMGIIVTILILSIVGIGIMALSGLDVSYHAFEKDMGPAAHKKAM